MRGNVFIPIPTDQIYTQLPEQLAKRYSFQSDDQGPVTPTWAQVAIEYKKKFGTPLLVEWTDDKKYVVIELAVSFMTGEMDEIQALREAYGIQKGDVSSPAFGRLMGSELTDFLDQISKDKIKEYTNNYSK